MSHCKKRSRLLACPQVNIECIFVDQLSTCMRCLEMRLPPHCKKTPIGQDPTKSRSKYEDDDDEECEDDDDGSTALHKAAWMGHRDVVALLLDKMDGASIAATPWLVERVNTLIDNPDAPATAEIPNDALPPDIRAELLEEEAFLRIRRFERTGSMEDLNCAIETMEQAVKSTPIDHTNNAVMLNNLGNALRRRF